MANSGFRIFFAPREKTTSDYISDMCGVGEVRGISKSISVQADGGLAVGLGYSPQSRRCFLPHETRYLGDDEALVFDDLPGFIRAGRKPYFLDDEWAGCYDPGNAQRARRCNVRRGGDELAIMVEEYQNAKRMRRRFCRPCELNPA